MSSTRPLGRMLISQADNREIDIDIQKVSRGSFYTTKNVWLNEPVKDFLRQALPECSGRILDPFAGDGHLLEAVKEDPQLSKLVNSTSGLDLEGPWRHNDSLLDIPNPEGKLILTNPPYLANHSARRKGVSSLVSDYFNRSGQNNLYKVALDNSLQSAKYVIAIIPETFLLSSYPKNRLEVAVVIEDDLFEDTEAPALVACFGPNETSNSKVFVGENLVGSLNQILGLRDLSVRQRPKISFNDPTGKIGLRAVDGSDGITPIQFLRASEFGYSKDKVLVSSRLMTYISVPSIEEDRIDPLIAFANGELNRIRRESKDLVLAPFKGNDKFGRRRRRLDYALARRILGFVASNLDRESRGSN